MADLKARETLTTGVNEVTFSSITGEGVDNIDKKYKIYKCAVIVSDAEKERILKQVKKFFKDNKSKDYKGKKPANWDNIVFTDKAGNNVISPYSRVDPKGDGKQVDITLVDGNRNPLDKDVYGSIGSGSKAAISSNIKMYESVGKEGVSIFLTAVQLVTFVPYTGGGNAAGNFEVIEDSENLAGDAANFAKKEEKKKDKKKKKKKGSE